MTMLLSLGRIAAVSVALIGFTLATIPAHAAPALGSSMNLDFGVQPPASGNNKMLQYHLDDDDDYWCYHLTNKQIRKGLHNAGFEDVEFVKKLKHNRVRVEALYEDDGWVYSMRIDRCDGEVDQIKPLYEAHDFDIDF